MSNRRLLPGASLQHTQRLLCAIPFNPRRYLPLLLIVVAIWYSSLGMAELAGDGAIPQPPEAMTWPMLPGESLNQLATLFYPGNKPMQRRFVAKTLELNRAINPALDPASIFDQPGTLIIPELKSLSRQAPPFTSHRHQYGKSALDLHLGYQPQDAAEFPVTPKMNVAYENLSKRNMALKAEQQQLDQRLATLQANLQQMQAMLMTQTAPVAVIPASAKALTATALPVRPPTKVEQAATLPIWNNLIAQCLMLLGALILALGTWIWVRRRMARKLGEATNGQMDAMRKNTFSHITNPPLVAADAGVQDNADLGILAVEEIESVVDEARIFVSMDRTNEAITLLLSYIETRPKGSVQPWVYLLDIYRSQNKQDEYIALAKRFHHTFNVMQPPWEDTKVAMIVATSLEEFPHIIAHLVAAWTAGEAMQYLQELLDDNRDGERAGFTLQVLQEIMLLQSILGMRDGMPDKIHNTGLELS